MGKMLLRPTGRVFFLKKKNSPIPLLMLQPTPKSTPTLAQLLDGSGETQDKKMMSCIGSLILV
jgi:hypothetical protein